MYFKLPKFTEKWQFFLGVNYRLKGQKLKSLKNDNDFSITREQKVFQFSRNKKGTTQNELFFYIPILLDHLWELQEEKWRKLSLANVVLFIAWSGDWKRFQYYKVFYQKNSYNYW